MNDRISPSVHDMLFLLLSDMIALERNVAQLRPQQIQRQLRRLSSQLSDMLPDVEEFDQLDEKISQLEKRIRIIGLSQGEDLGEL